MDSAVHLSNNRPPEEVNYSNKCKIPRPKPKQPLQSKFFCLLGLVVTRNSFQIVHVIDNI